MKKETTIAVLTCDIVRSSQLQESELKAFQQRIELLGKNVLFPVQFYRGDSFQLATKPVDALEIAVLIRIELKRFHEQNDVRISIGVGEVKALNQNVLLSTGPAFEISGKNLDQLKDWNLNLYIQTEKPALNDELETYCYFADAIVNGFTRIQSNIIYLKLQGLSQKEIADKLGISQPAISKSLKAANWHLIERFRERYKKLIKQNYGDDV